MGAVQYAVKYLVTVSPTIALSTMRSHQARVVHETFHYEYVTRIKHTRKAIQLCANNCKYAKVEKTFLCI